MTDRAVVTSLTTAQRLAMVEAQADQLRAQLAVEEAQAQAAAEAGLADAVDHGADVLAALMRAGVPVGPADVQRLVESVLVAAQAKVAADVPTPSPDVPEDAPTDPTDSKV